MHQENVNHVEKRGLLTLPINQNTVAMVLGGLSRIQPLIKFGYYVQPVTLSLIGCTIRHRNLVCYDPRKKVNVVHRLTINIFPLLNSLQAHTPSLIGVSTQSSADFCRRTIRIYSSSDLLMMSWRSFVICDQYRPHITSARVTTMIAEILTKRSIIPSWLPSPGLVCYRSGA